MASNFMFKAKAGLLSLDQHDRQISSKGRIADIRRHTEEAIPYGGIPYIANLGSQNAIGGTNEPPAPIVTFIKPKETKPLIGGDGGKQSQESKNQAYARKHDEEAEKVTAPKTVPPFNLDTANGKKEIKEWADYLRVKFWRLYDTDKDPFGVIYGDSLDYTKFLQQRKKAMMKAQAYYKAHPHEQNFGEILKFLVPLGQIGVDFLAEEAKKKVQFDIQIPTLPENATEDQMLELEMMKQAKALLEAYYPPDIVINHIRDFVKNILPKQAHKDIYENINDITNKMFKAKPAWKARFKMDYNKEMTEGLKEFDS
jgi:hypothetical protein